MIRRSTASHSSQPPPSPTKEEEPNLDHVLNRMTAQQRQELCFHELYNFVWKYSVSSMYNFFHARTGPRGCRVAGWIRVCYAVVFCYSRVLLAVELPFLLDPLTGVMPYRVTKGDLNEFEWSIFAWAPESRLVLYGVFYLGLAAGLTLLLGILPRWSAAAVFWFNHNLHNHNSIIWDNQEHMFRVWAFFLILMPLDHITVYDGFGGWCSWVKTIVSAKSRQRMQHQITTLFGRVVSAKSRQMMQRHISTVNTVCVQKCHRSKLDRDIESNDATNAVANNANNISTATQKQSSSWPMWPFRLFQVYTCFVYIGAGLCKFNTPPWRNGTALWWLWYDDGFGRFFPNFVSEFLFNRLAMAKIQTWIALSIELGSIVCIWIPSLRWKTFLAIVVLHIGIELTLIMHAFEYLAVIGWLPFFAFPNDTLQKNTNASTDAHVTTPKKEGVAIHHSGSDEKSEKIKKGSSGGLTNLVKTPKKRKMLLESTIATALLYYFIVDTMPRQEILKVLPMGVRHLTRSTLFPSAAITDFVADYGELIGIHSSQWTVYRGIPPHSHYHLTAVIQYNNGTDPSIWTEENFYERNDLYSLYMRERYYWTQTFTYYLSKEYAGDTEGIPFIASFSLYLARKYSNGHIQYHPSRQGSPTVSIDSDSPIKSVSLMAHSKTGEAPPENFPLWESTPRSWSYESTCNYVMDMDQLLDELPNPFRIQRMYDYDEEKEFAEESGCFDMDPVDKALHLSHGSYLPDNEKKAKIQRVLKHAKRGRMWS